MAMPGAGFVGRCVYVLIEITTVFAFVEFARFALFLLAVVQAIPAAAGMPEILFVYPGDEKGYWGETARSLTKEISVKSNGEVRLRVEPARYYVKGADTPRALRAGFVDIAVVDGYSAARLIPLVGALTLPLLVTSPSDGKRLVEGEVGGILQKATNAEGMVILGWNWRVGAFVSSSRCIIGPSDVKGKRIIGGSPTHSQVLEYSGASIARYRGKESYFRLMKGADDGALMLIDSIRSLRLHESTRCLTIPRDEAFMVVPELILANKALWEARPRRHREVIRRVLNEVMEEAISKSKDSIATLEGMFKDSGRKVAVMSSEHVEAWRRNAKQIYDAFAKRHGDEILNLAKKK